MKFSVNWLREFVDLPKNLEEIAELLTRAGVETENIETRSANVEEVIVSQIAASSRHPNADRLTVCEVMMAVERNAKSFAGRPITKSATKFRLRCPEQSCRTELKFEKANCVALKAKECFAVQSSSAWAKMLRAC